MHRRVNQWSWVDLWILDFALGFRTVHFMSAYRLEVVNDQVRTFEERKWKKGVFVECYLDMFHFLCELRSLECLLCSSLPVACCCTWILDKKGVRTDAGELFLAFPNPSILMLWSYRHRYRRNWCAGSGEEI
jgi:hypothetical protein